MDNVLVATDLRLLSLVEHLVLASQSLFELHLLLHLLLLVCKDRVLALTRASWIVVEILSFLACRSHHGAHEGVIGISHDHCIVVLNGRHIHGVGHGSWVASRYKLVGLLLIKHIGCLHKFVLFAGASSTAIIWWIVAWRKHWVWHTFVILVRIYVDRVAVGLRWHVIVRMIKYWTHNLGIIDTWVDGMLGISGLAWKISVPSASSVAVLVVQCRPPHAVVSLLRLVLRMQRLIEILFYLLLLGYGHVSEVVGTNPRLRRRGGILSASYRFLNVSSWDWFRFFSLLSILSLLL